MRIRGMGDECQVQSSRIEYEKLAGIPFMENLDEMDSSPCDLYYLDSWSIVLICNWFIKAVSIGGSAMKTIT